MIKKQPSIPSIKKQGQEIQKELEQEINALTKEIHELQEKLREKRVLYLENKTGFKIGDYIQYEDKEGKISSTDENILFWKYNPKKKDGTQSDREFVIYEYKKAKKIKG